MKRRQIEIVSVIFFYYLCENYNFFNLNFFKFFVVVQFVRRYYIKGNLVYKFIIVYSISYVSEGDWWEGGGER